MTEQKLCECGCGQPVPLSKRTNRKMGYIKGQPLRFVRGHQGYLTKWTDEQREKFRQKTINHPVSDETRQKISRNHRIKGIKPSPEAVTKSNMNRKRREESPSWKGGTSITNGYRCIYKPNHPRSHSNGYVYEHILIAETKLNRPLVKGEVVHHIDGNKLNNDPDNLQVFPSQSEHVKFHQEQDEN